MWWAHDDTGRKNDGQRIATAVAKRNDMAFVMFETHRNKELPDVIPFLQVKAAQHWGASQAKTVTLRVQYIWAVVDNVS